MNYKNILITGGAGFIGSNLAMEIQNRFPFSNITVFDKFNNGLKRTNYHYAFFGDYRNLIDFKGTIISGDLTSDSDMSKLLNFNFDIIFHQAAISDTTVTNQEEVLKTNSNTFNHFLNYVKENSCKLIYASSAGTYGNSLSPNIVGYGEVPENVYGFSKLSMDNMTRIFLKTNPSKHVIGLRYFNVYGPGELYKRKTSSMILQLIGQILDKNKVRIFKFGEQSRDFVYIKDVVQANLKAIDGRSGIYNIGYGQTRSFNDIVKILSECFNREIEIEYFDNPYSFYQNNTCADISGSIVSFGYNPGYSLEKGIQDYFQEIIQYNPRQWASFYE
jgi:ADP-L-glycero-D-manno-heptose 6-epimerase